MDTVLVALALLAFGALGAALWLLRERYRLTLERDVARARLADQERSLGEFEGVAGRVLRSSNEEFLRLAKETLAARETSAVAQIDERTKAFDALVGPIRETLQRTQEELQRVERGHGGLREQVGEMQRASQALREETGRLAQALRKPNVRGRYGEIQLERVIELAGMRSYSDFAAQENLRDEDGRLQKPDVVVRLPNSRCIAIDAKTSIDSYLDALDAPTREEQDALLDRYAENVIQQAQKLSRKEYWRHFDESPEFVVMFIPGDQLVDAALERRPRLIELAAEQNVVIASPSTLIGLLRAVHVGWRERSLSESAQELFRLGRELHERAAVALGHAAKVGESLNQARDSYNRFVASVDARLLPTLRKFEERGAASGKTVAELKVIESEARELEAGDEAGLLFPAVPPLEAEGENEAEAEPEDGPGVERFPRRGVQLRRDEP